MNLRLHLNSVVKKAVVYIDEFIQNFCWVSQYHLMSRGEVISATVPRVTARQSGVQVWYLYLAYRRRIDRAVNRDAVHLIGSQYKVCCLRYRANLRSRLEKWNLFREVEVSINPNSISQSQHILLPQVRQSRFPFIHH